MLYITEEEVLNLIKWDDTFKAVEISMHEVARKNAYQPGRSTTIVNDASVLLSMPGYLDNSKFRSLACKLVTSFNNNSSLPEPVPVVNANILYFDEVTGILKAVIAGNEITKWRTAAASAVATKYLHIDQLKRCEVLAILGSGHQGQSHAECFYHLFKFKEIRIWNHHIEKAKKLVDDLNSRLKTNIFKVSESVEKCVENADVINTATNALSPILKFDWIKSDVHINAIGVNRNHCCELDLKIYNNSDIYIDYWEGARNELKGLLDAGLTFVDEIGGVISSGIKPTNKKITVFQSLGMAVEDCVMAKMIYDLYMQKH